MLAQHPFASLLLIAIDLAEDIQLGIYLYCTATGTSIQYYCSPFISLQMCKVIRVSSRIVQDRRNLGLGDGPTTECTHNCTLVCPD